MYTIKDGSANGNYFQTGHNEDQVLDTSTAENAIHQRNAQANTLQLQKQKQAADKQDDLLKTIAKSGATKVKPGDLDYFKKGTADLYKNATSYFDSNGNISTDNYMKLLAQANQLSTEADVSKNQRERIEAENAKYDPTKHYGEEYEKNNELYTTPGNWGQSHALQEKLDRTKYSTDVLGKIADDYVNSSKIGVVRFGNTEGADLLNRTFDSNSSIKRSAMRDATDANGGKPVTEDEAKAFYIKEQLPNVVKEKHTQQSASWAAFGAKQDEKKPTVTEIPPANTEGEGTYVVDKTNIPADKVVQNLVIGGKNVAGTLGEVKYKIEDGKKVITGGTLIPFLTEDDKQTIADNKVKKAQWNNDLEAYEKSNPRPNPARYDTKEDIDKAIAKWGNGLPKLSSARYKQEPVNDKPIKIDKNQAVSIAFNKYGLNIPELAETGTTDANILKIKKDQQGANWEYGGHSAPEREWIANGWTAEKLQKHAKKK